ncbi:MAG: zinc ribbon domain-containing protein [Candidatus Hermodarchaeota archaeon]
MGFKRVFWSGVVGMIFLIPTAWISFRFLNLTEGVTGGLIVNIDDALAIITSTIGGAGGLAIEILAGAFIGLALVFSFPVHWCIIVRPEDILLIIAITLPWILCCVITSGLFAHSPKGGINSSLAIGIGYAIILSVIYIILSFTFIGDIIDGVMLELTELPYLIAVLTSILEGCLIGAVFGAFVGSLKYKPGRTKGKKGKEKKVTEISDVNKAIESSVAPTKTTCPNCGAKLLSDDLFCTNCGAKTA